jgi:methylenetetrahydrofolate reductase (NADPH)
MQFYKMELKIAVGASFIITQLGFNLRKLYEVKQYMNREGLQEAPIIANVYVPTAFVAKMMKQGLIAGTVASDELIERLESESKAERLERAANMVAAVRDLGFSGAHLGGFGLTHDDFHWITRRANELGDGWKNHVDDLIFEYPGEFYLFPKGADGLSDGDGEYQISESTPRAKLKQTISRQVHRLLIKEDSWGAGFLAPRLKNVEDGRGATGFWHRALGLSRWYRKATLGCMDCGDCIQDHLNYAGCPMNGCYKNLRNGPCGGSRTDGTCEADPRIHCIWNEIYSAAIACDDDPRKFGRTLIPPREWNLDRTNALVNRLKGLDNLGQRKTVGRGASSNRKTSSNLPQP